MRKSPILDALFPEVRGKILGALFMQPEKQWYQSELSAFIGTQPSSLQREIEKMCMAGILQQHKDGRRVYLKPDARSPIFSDLKNLFDRTVGIIPILSHELESFWDNIHLAFLYGSMARGQEESASDIDLMIVGAVKLSALVPALRRAEKQLGRPVNVTLYSLEEFTYKARGKDHFLNTVLKGVKDFVIGDTRELAKIIGKK